jgi:hypothetical protein
MGSRLSRCTRKQKSADITDAETRDPLDKKKTKNIKIKNKTKKDKKKSKEMEETEPFRWETDLLEQKLMGSGFVTHAAIVSCEDGKPKATCPKDFVPDLQGIQDILAALNGDASNIAERGIILGTGTTSSLGPFTPGKMDEGKAIYAGNGQGGGCTVYKTKSSVLITVHDKNPDVAIRQTSEVAEFMVENDR